MVIQICNSLFKASLEEKNEKQKKEEWFASDIFFNFRLLSLPRFYENAPVFFCIFDIFNNYGLKCGQNNTGKLYSHVAGVTVKNRNLNSQLLVAMRSPL